MKVLGILGMVGNTTVIYGTFKLHNKSTGKVYRQAPLKSLFTSKVTDILVANLAAADFLFTAFCPIWSIERFENGEWILGSVMCRTATFVRYYFCLN